MTTENSVIQLLIRYFAEKAKTISMKYRSQKLHGCYLPVGARILSPENVSIGKDFIISPYCQIICQDAENGSVLTIGNRVALNLAVHINADNSGKIIIGDNVIIGPNTTLRSSNHKFDRMDIPIRDQEKEPGYIIIEDDVWLGAGVIVVPNVRIGKGAVIGAGSVVTKDIPAFSVAVGNPAKVIKIRK